VIYNNTPNVVDEHITQRLRLPLDVKIRYLPVGLNKVGAPYNVVKTKV